MSDAALQREEIGDVTIVRPALTMMRSDRATSELFDQLYSLVDVEGRAKLVLELSRVEFLSSEVIGRIVGLMRRTRAAGGRLVICRPSPIVVELFSLTRLIDILPMYDHELEAVRSFE